MTIKYIFVADKQKEKILTPEDFCKLFEPFGIQLQWNNVFIKVEGILLFYQRYDMESKTEKIFGFQPLLSSTELEDFQERMIRFIDANKDIFEIINMVWNDSCFNLSKQAYPQIYTIENNMRELITRFMLKNFGAEWETKYLPKFIIDKVKSNINRELSNQNTAKSTKKKVKKKLKAKQYPYENIIFYLDFIDLSKLLFIPYAEITGYAKYIEQYLNSPDKLKKLIPKNNWDRGFNKIVNIDGKEFETKWQALYNIRCKVAHNRMMTKEDYDSLKTLIEDINPIITKALKPEIPLLTDEEKIAYIMYHIAIIIKDESLKPLVDICETICYDLSDSSTSNDDDDDESLLIDKKPEYIELLLSLKTYIKKMSVIDDFKFFERIENIYRKNAILFFDELSIYDSEIKKDNKITEFTKGVRDESFFTTIPTEMEALTKKLNQYYYNLESLEE